MNETFQYCQKELALKRQDTEQIHYTHYYHTQNPFQTPYNLVWLECKFGTYNIYSVFLWPSKNELIIVHPAFLIRGAGALVRVPAGPVRATRAAGDHSEPSGRQRIKRLLQIRVLQEEAGRVPVFGLATIRIAPFIQRVTEHLTAQ